MLALGVKVSAKNAIHAPNVSRSRAANDKALQLVDMPEGKASLVSRTGLDPVGGSCKCSDELQACGGLVLRFRAGALGLARDARLDARR